MYKNYKVTPAKITFRAESTEPETKNNVELKPPFKSNYGLKTGIAYTGIASSFTLLANLANGLNIKNHIKRLEEKGKIEHSPKYKVILNHSEICSVPPKIMDYSSYVCSNNGWMRSLCR